MDEASGELGEEREALDGIPAAAAADAVPGEELGSRDMEPVELTSHTQACFIGVSNGGP